MHDPRALVILCLPIVTALTVVALNAVLVELGRSRIWAAGLSLVFAFGPMAWHYSGVMFSEPLLALMMVLALLGLVRFRRTRQMRWMLAAGSASGVALLARDDSLFLVLVPFAIYAALVVLRRNPSWAWRARGALAWLVPIGAAGLFALAYHLMRYGSGSGPYANDGMGFTQPLLGGLYGLLLSPGAGLLVFVPVLALAFFGFPEFFRRWRAEASLIAALVAVRLPFFAGWRAWAGGATRGPRYPVPPIPLMPVPVALPPPRRPPTAAPG